jgi:hypothetical protein
VPPVLSNALARKAEIAKSGIDVYAPLADLPHLVFSREELSALLSHELVGTSFGPVPIKTRSKLAKEAVCVALGYPVPARFSRSRPRFPGQDFDMAVQQRDNFQLWNDNVSPTRRYVFIRADADGTVSRVKVIEGTALTAFDRTGTLTHKYQAKRRPEYTGSHLVSAIDSAAFIAKLEPVERLSEAELAALGPSEPPTKGKVLKVATLYERLLGLVGREMPYAPSERLRGELLHRAACDALGLASYADTGQFPDILCQAVEVKLQTSPTIDLGLVSPDSRGPALTLSPSLRHCDVRYLVAYAERRDETLRIDHIVVSVGEDFFGAFQQFGGLVRNGKLQFHLPTDFFD